MSKRGAGSYLTDQNWDQEETSEEAGTFSQASADELGRRQIRKARRTVPQNEMTGSKPAFTAFSGFTAAASDDNTSKPLFNFGGNIKPLFQLSNGSSTKSDTLTTSLTGSALVKTASSEVKTSDVISKSSNPTLGVATSSSSTSTTNPTNGACKKSGVNRTKYLQQLRALNKSVSDWIHKHVEENASCILTPIFRDYEKHLAEIEKKYPENEAPETELQQKASNANTSASQIALTNSAAISVQKPLGGGFKFSTEKSNEIKSQETEKKEDKPSFSFGLSSSAAATKPSSGFSFGTSSSSSLGSDKPSLFSSGTTKPFSFAVSTTASTESTGEEEYEPPKVDVVEVKEDGSLYSKRCKLFYQKDGNWLEKGVGNLHLKSLGDKTQLLIRADTNLGNILLNIMLTDSMPVKRQGKNNVSLICVPNPPLNPKEPDAKPASLLLRVKTGEDADDLLAKINQHKK